MLYHDPRINHYLQYTKFMTTFLVSLGAIDLTHSKTAGTFSKRNCNAM